MTSPIKLHISKNLSLPIDVVTQKLAWMGRTGSGKTYGFGKLAEEMLSKGIQVVILDPVGIHWGSTCSGQRNAIPMKQIPLSGKLGKGKFALVDDEDFEELNKYKWNLNSDGYVRRTTTLKKRGGETKRKRVTIYLNRFLMDTSNGMEADHRDGNKLNNQKYNLRNCTRKENEHNKNKTQSNTSGYKGVSYEPSRNKWIASIYVNGKNIHLGRYDKDTDAAQAYNEAAIKHHGEFTKLNLINQ